MGADAKVLRLVDANLNRAREGLRVVEDTARFVWNDKKQYERVRSIRHALHAVSQKAYKNLVSARESVNDVGREISEGPRKNLKAVVSANMRRAQEAVRVLEEYGKVFSPKAAPELKKIRYRLYQEEKRLLQRI